MEPSWLLVLPLLLALSAPCHACRCKLQHPQTFFCKSDIVLLADILKLENKTKTRRIFTVNVTKILKAPKGVTEIHKIYSPRDIEECGYMMRTAQQSHLLIAGYMTGKKVRFTRCHLVYLWYRLSRQQRLGFESLYSKACSCQIKPCLLCWRTCPQPDSSECVWKQRDCEYNIWQGNLSMSSMCTLSHSGRCEWAPIPLLTALATPTSLHPSPKASISHLSSPTSK
ncbi:metalloproteinase inhibitor 1-like [Tupaia chinensis]|uniref:metalloproteinase inhibitor 1-like n=1 Tax=Tupaia chinensis TaxID=246437 RepID=UPI0003C92363|nr:metalloproteinase inhibitor 1-like [Tupaia chinensis]XP_014444877.1 metalloproteinase inhibitor 1-like [Tupaia chinensis]XP_014444878.1 metalloproteinase inhibitor 1-like [Tupaia chinensis]